MASTWASDLDLLRRRYFQQTPLRHIRWPTPLELDRQEQILDATFLSRRPSEKPAASFSHRFFKALINHAEASGAEISERVLEVFMDLLAAKVDGGIPQESTFKSYRLPSAGDGDGARADGEGCGACHLDEKWITIREDQLLTSGGTTGLHTWNASLRFAEFLSSNPTIIANRSILELGSGVGFLGLACSLLGARSVTMTDVDDDVIKRLTENVELNRTRIGASVVPDVQKLDWDEAREPSAAEIIIGADIMYDPSLASPLARVLGFLMRRDGGCRAVAWLAATLRQEETFATFKSALMLEGLYLERVGIEGVPDHFFHDEEARVILLRVT
ncbi:putative methyltransferase-domain-containing protein [Blyttiomyces helicus]|uniref:Putative methyltransferase-domain-containing protein n=1 Tax=Blyttiomyces helicus TaxID=388810 RepID=A0A4P9VZP9_9FUNG|nr:putative methyltransferase-domain-containing protein [Blyttiomyces helicus]|eukprot:RKO83868.1 putative methyltransferase-domain-containing protein [Blyttiomyces helicus]